MRWTLGAIITLLAAQNASADLPPGPPGVSWASPVYLVEADSLLPDYVCILNQRHWKGNKLEWEKRLVPFDPENPLVIHLHYNEECHLFLVSRPATPYTSASDVLAAVDRHEACVIARVSFDYRIAVPSWRAGRIVVMYRVRATDSGAGLEIIRDNWNYPLLEWCFAVGFLVAGIVGGGLWFIRRRRRSRARVPA